MDPLPTVAIDPRSIEFFATERGQAVHQRCKAKVATYRAILKGTIA